ncbi:MAG: hypothetical protein CML13_17560 [Puniceicoccaceae bacterium]|nr:hypothetical protein [Puniceicoccaceae bacterium]
MSRLRNEVAHNNSIELAEAAAREAIVTPLRSLPPHPDVKAGLQALEALGVRLISFTNSSNKGVQTQFENAGLIEFFEARYSIEDIQIYKPALAMVLTRLGRRSLLGAAKGCCSTIF